MRPLEVYMSVQEDENLDMNVSQSENVNVEVEQVVRSSSTSNYEELDNLPKINDVTVIGNKNGNAYGLINSDDELRFQEIDNYFQAVFGN